MVYCVARCLSRYGVLDRSTDNAWRTYVRICIVIFSPSLFFLYFTYYVKTFSTAFSLSLERSGRDMPSIFLSLPKIRTMLIFPAKGRMDEAGTKTWNVAAKGFKTKASLTTSITVLYFFSFFILLISTIDMILLLSIPTRNMIYTVFVRRKNSNK